MIPKYYEFQNSSKILSGEFALECGNGNGDRHVKT